MTTKAPSILIVEDEALVATEIEMILRRLGYRIAGNTRNGDQALDLLANRKPDLALLDIHIKGTRNGIDLAKHIREKHHIPFVFLTAFSDRATLSEVGKTMPYGYVVKPFNERDLLSSIELALHKHSSEQSDGFPGQEQLNAQLTTPLTQREYEVLRQLDRGLTYQQVSDELNVSINTVKTYQKAIFSKMGASSRLECLRMARKMVMILLLLLASFGGILGQNKLPKTGNPEMNDMLAKIIRVRRSHDTTLYRNQLDTLKVIAEKDGRDLAKGIYHIYYAKYWVRMGDYELARQQDGQAIALLEGQKPDSYLITAYLDMARNYGASGNYLKVFEYGQKAYDLADPKDGFFQGNALNTMAIAKRRMGAQEEAIRYFRRAIPKLKNDPDRISPMINIASCYENLGNVDSTIHYFEKSMHLARNMGKRGSVPLGVILVNYGQFCSNHGNPDKALTLVKEATEIFSQFGNPNQRLAAEHATAKAYVVKDEFEKAIPHFQEAKRLVDKTKILDSQVEVYGGYLQALILASNNDSIYYYSQQYNLYNDSLTAFKRDEAMAEMETKFEVREKEAEIAASEQKLKQQRWLIGLTLLGLVTVASFLWYVYRQRQRISTQNEVIATSLAEKETLLKEIHHRVKNNLQMVSTLLSLQSNYVDDPSALDALQMGRSRVRSMAIIHQGLYMQDSVTPTIAANDYLQRLTGELMASYTDPQKVVKLTTNYEAIPLDIDRLIPLGLIANELITNAMKYAFQNRDEGQLTASFTQETGAQLMLRIADDGPGSDALYQEQTDSFGSLLVRTLTDQLNGRLEVKSSDGTDVRVIFEA